MSYNKKDEDSGQIVSVDKTSVFQEARVFNQVPWIIAKQASIAYPNYRVQYRLDDAVLS